MMNKYFEYRKHKTNFKTEVIAGVTTFLTMAYIMFLNPFILSGEFAGVEKGFFDFGAVFTATIVATALACFIMTCQELITASTENIPVKVVVFNNGNHGMVRQWQKIFYNSKFSASELTHDTPDYVKLAESMGAVGMRMMTMMLVSQGW